MEYRSNDSGIYIKYDPEIWTIKEYFQGSQVTFFKKGSDEIDSKASLSVFVHKNIFLDINRIFLNTLDQINNILSNFKYSDITSDQESVSFEYEGTVNGVKIKCIQMIRKYGNTVCSITYGCSEAHFDRCSSCYKNLIDNIQFLYSE